MINQYIMLKLGYLKIEDTDPTFTS